jgi:hypothetical protein
MKMSAAQETKEVVELAVGYTKQMVEALTPIAKQAYEIGLVTLQIDAAQVLCYSVLILGLSAATLWKIRAIWMQAQAKAALPNNKGDWYTRHPTDHMVGDGVPHFMIGGFAILASSMAIIKLVSIWAWVKLFSPELWLAHQAVEKLLK